MLQELRRRPCIGAVAQSETGGDLLLHFGEWQLYEDPPDPKLLTSERGCWSLMVMCPWRLDGPAGAVCDWRSVAEPERENADAYLQFEGLVVDAIRVGRPGLDLEIDFDRGYRLRTLCDSSGKTNDCWYLLLPDDSSLVANRRHQLLHEPPGSTT